MFGNPVNVEEDAVIFRLVWTYVIKALEGRKKLNVYAIGHLDLDTSRF
jgi:hypothetical protein